MNQRHSYNQNLIAVALAILLAVGSLSTAHALGSRKVHNNPKYTYGGLPDWLPKNQAPVQKIVETSPGHPKMGLSGDIMEYKGPTGTIQASMSGPDVPGGPSDVQPSNFYITIKSVAGSTIVHSTDFTIIDGDGVTINPTKFADGSRAMTVPTGSTKTVEISTIAAIGTGSIRWSYNGNPLAVWEFVVETN